MRIEQLHYEAFGPFTDYKLDLSGSGLQVIYGPNEAGKSSALRGMNSWLYGISAQTSDGFLHPYHQLKVSGVLADPHGNRLRFSRRKGNSNTLLAADQTTLSESELQPYLQGITQELFTTLFAIDHQALVAGGDAILQQKGEVGQLLFAAAMGGQPLHQLLQVLEDNASGLFSPRASSKVIPKLLKEYQALTLKMKQSSLAQSVWQQKNSAAESISSALRKVEGELQQQKTELHRMERMHQLIPKITRYQGVIAQQKALGAVKLLSETFAQRHQEVIASLSQKEVHLKLLASQQQTVAASLQSLVVDPTIFLQEVAIEQLYQHLGAYQQAQKELPLLQQQHQQLCQQAERLLKGIRPDLLLEQAEELRPLLLERTTISSLKQQYVVMESQLEAAIEEQEQEQLHLQQLLNSKKRSLPQIEDLTQAIKVASKETTLDQQITATERDYTQLYQRNRDALLRLSLWQGSAEAFRQTALPNEVTIAQGKDRYETLLQEQQQSQEHLTANTQSLAQLEQQLAQLELQGTLPNPELLLQHRGERNQIWQAIRKHCLEGELPSEQKLDHYEQKVEVSDKTADHLWQEAEKVQQRAQIRLKIAQHQQRLEALQRTELTQQEEMKQWLTQWQMLWSASGITPLLPKEMERWHLQAEKLLGQLIQEQDLKLKLEALQQQRQQQLETLQRELSKIGDQGAPQPAALEPLVLYCEDLRDSLQQQQQQLQAEATEQRRLVVNIEQKKLTIERLNRQKQQWQQQLQQLCAKLGLQQECTIDLLAQMGEEVVQILDLLSKAEQLSLRLKTIQEDESAYTSKVESLAQRLFAPETIPSVIEAVNRLQQELQQQRNLASQQQQKNQELMALQQELQPLKVSVAQYQQQLAELCTEAEGTPEKLEALIQDSAKWQRLDTEREALMTEIDHLRGSTSFATLEQEVKEIDYDQLPGEIEQIRYQIDTVLEPRRSELTEQRGEINRELELLYGKDEAANLALEAESLLAMIRRNSEQYVTFKLASQILQEQIELYRQQNQGPLLQRAGEIFSALTLNSFSHLTTQFNQRDEPEIVGCRHHGSEIPVTGMSSGSRDQLYLSLRLATLEKYLDDKAPVPLIVDDILTDFDDARTASALEILANLSQKTQVILFTHHQAVLEQAKAMATGTSSGIHVHQLQCQNGTP
ncbi:MAG: AAA family ATPase [Gammaproteobacteria bacterium]|nr:AAA family ATPase [Gammaproteobacteria bacterium]